MFGLCEYTPIVVGVLCHKTKTQKYSIQKNRPKKSLDKIGFNKFDYVTRIVLLRCKSKCHELQYPYTYNWDLEDKGTKIEIAMIILLKIQNNGFNKIIVNNKMYITRYG